ncbi:MAG: hypothetical protein DMG57_21910 [Acidobacteria bacterium]|nr:MAG: hypothetical protein DMG57_21910 [Acidobacteriota bacterium]
MPFQIAASSMKKRVMSVMYIAYIDSMYISRYIGIMRVTITRLRQELFRLADQALEGKPVEFVHKGVVFHITPESKRSKLAKLTAQKVVAPKANLKRADRELLKEMTEGWEQDWSEL